MFFAEELPTSPIEPANAVIIVIGLQLLLILVLVACAVMTVVIAARRKPAIEAEFATKTELHALRAELTSSTNAIFSEIKSMNVGMNAEFSSLNRSLGKLEGQQHLAKSIIEEVRK